MRPHIAAILSLVCTPLAAASLPGGDGNKGVWKLPIINLAVAYRQFEDGKLGKSVYIAQLYCGGSSCELLTAHLNWCLPLRGKEQEGFEIGLTRSSTDDSSLEIVMYHCNNGQGVIAVKKHWLGAEITYRFGFTLLDCTKPVPAMVSLLTSFDGVGIQAWPDKTETWTLLPFKGESDRPYGPWYARWTPDCPLVLPGVPGP